jgi:flagellar hook-associated protein 3 FlgL
MTIEIKNATPTQLLLNYATQQKDSLAEVSIQISSGNKYNDFEGFANEGNVERYLSYSSSSQFTTSFLQSNNVISSRIGTMSKTLDQLQDIASNLSQLIAQSRNSASGSDIPVDVLGKSMLDDIAGKLNIKFDGRYLFSGTKSDTPPVSNVQSNTIADDGTPTASYYAGDSEKASIKISNSEELEYGVAGNETGFQQLIGAVHLAITGHNDGNNDETLGKAMDMVSEAISNLASVRSTLGSAQNTINEANATHNATDLLVKENLKDISQTNIVDATTKMSELQATLQATYLAFQRLNQLRLANYLN